MRRSTILFLIAATAFSFGACKKKDTKKAEDKGMAPAADMQPGDMKPEDMRPAPMRAAPPAAFAHMDKVLAHQKAYIKMLEGIKTVADVKKNKDAYFKANVQAMQDQVDAMKLALKLDDAQFKAYLAKADQLQKANAELGKKVVALMKGISKIKGIKKLSKKMQKELLAKQKPLLKEMGELAKKYMARKAKLAGGMKADAMKPADMKADMKAAKKAMK